MKKVKKPVYKGPLFVIQVGAFFDRDKANQLVNDLRRKGYAAGVHESKARRSDKRTLYLVRIGEPLPSKTAIAIPIVPHAIP